MAHTFKALKSNSSSANLEVPKIFHVCGIKKILSRQKFQLEYFFVLQQMKLQEIILTSNISFLMMTCKINTQ